MGPSSIFVRVSAGAGGSIIGEAARRIGPQGSAIGFCVFCAAVSPEDRQRIPTTQAAEQSTWQQIWNP
jgi:hypothetical protein